MIEDGLRIDISGTKRWYKDGLQHRLDGPAVIWEDGVKEWYQDGLLHRDNGPAVVYPNSKYKEWWYEGKLLEISQESISELLEVVVG